MSCDLHFDDFRPSIVGDFIKSIENNPIHVWVDKLTGTNESTLSGDKSDKDEECIINNILHEDLPTQNESNTIGSLSKKKGLVSPVNIETKSLTEPTTPNLRTKARGAMHQAALERKVAMVSIIFM